ncbi:hypothetical protein T09_536, partial [Trichinella sp. T9]
LLTRSGSRIKYLGDVDIVDRFVWMRYMGEFKKNFEPVFGTVSKLAVIFRHIGYCNTLKIQAGSKTFLKEIVEMLIQCKVGSGNLVLIVYNDFVPETVAFLFSKEIKLHLHSNLIIYIFRGNYLRRLFRLFHINQLEENRLADGSDDHSRGKTDVKNKSLVFMMRFIQTLRRYPWIRNFKLVEERTSARQVVELFSNRMTNFESFEMSRIAVPLMTFQIRLAPPPPLKSLTLHYSREGASMLGLFIGGFFDIPSKRIHLTVDWMFDRAEEFLQILQLIFEMNATIELTFGVSDESNVNEEGFTWPQRLFQILRGFSAINYHPWLFHDFFSTGTFEHLESICLNDQSDVDGLLRIIAEKCPKLADLIVCAKGRRRSVTPDGILAFLHKWQLRVVKKLSIMWFTKCTMQKVFSRLSADETVSSNFSIFYSKRKVRAGFGGKKRWFSKLVILDKDDRLLTVQDYVPRLTQEKMKFYVEGGCDNSKEPIVAKWIE